MNYNKESVKTYTFGPLSFQVKNYRGVWFPSDALKERIRNLSIEEAKAVNREAWKQQRKNTYIANRHNNWSINGNIDIYEETASHADVAQCIAKESYKAMMQFA